MGTTFEKISAKIEKQFLDREERKRTGKTKYGTRWKPAPLLLSNRGRISPFKSYRGPPRADTSTGKVYFFLINNADKDGVVCIFPMTKSKDPEWRTVRVFNRLEVLRKKHGMKIEKINRTKADGLYRISGQLPPKTTRKEEKLLFDLLNDAYLVGILSASDQEKFLEISAEAGFRVDE